MEQIFESLLSSGVLVPAIWLSLALAILWFLLSAKQWVPLTRAEAETLWKVHKQQTNCGAKSWNEVVRRGKIIGFKCRCGHKHIQKKPIVNIKG